MKEFLSKLGQIWGALKGAKGKMPPAPTSPAPAPATAAPIEPTPATPIVPAPEAPIVPQQQPTLVKSTVPEEVPPPEKPPREKRPVRRYERTLVVGVDFGTSSTKVIWQDLSENYFESFRWKPNLRGLQSVLLPSTVIVRDGAIIFGEVIPASGDIWLPSIKLCVLCSRNASVCRCDRLSAKYGLIRIPGLSAPASASALACLFLAHVFQQVEQRLRSAFPNDEVIFIWNIGCPMDHLDAADTKTAWEKMAGVAMQLRGRVLNPADIALLHEAIELLDTFAPPPVTDRSFAIQPEGLAAVKAFLESPRGADQKTYAIVDVGAGTTEVSFFFAGRVHRKGGALEPSYLADSTEAVGGGRIDIELAEVWRCDVETARRRKEQGTESIPKLPSIEMICQQYDRTCRKILKGRKLTAKGDKRFDLFIVGGGGRLGVLRDSIASRLLPGEFFLENVRQLRPPPTLRDRADLDANYDLLANACGLASSLEWDYYPPHEVEAMAPLRMGPKRDRDELYPK